MRSFIALLFLTLVVISPSIRATPHNHSSKPPVIETDSEHDTTVINNDYLIVSPSKKSPFKLDKSKKSYYPYLQAMSPMLGILFDAANISKGGNLVLYKFDYLIPKLRSPQLEIGTDLVSDSTGFININYRWIHEERAPFRPYCKAGVSHHIIPKEQLASLANFKNYFINASCGIEDLLRPPMSIRLELFTLIGANKTWIGASMGYSWAW